MLGIASPFSSIDDARSWCVRMPICFCDIGGSGALSRPKPGPSPCRRPFSPVHRTLAPGGGEAYLRVLPAVAGDALPVLLLLLSLARLLLRPLVLLTPICPVCLG